MEARASITCTVEEIDLAKTQIKRAMQNQKYRWLMITYSGKTARIETAGFLPLYRRARKKPKHRSNGG